MVSNNGKIMQTLDCENAFSYGTYKVIKMMRLVNEKYRKTQIISQMINLDMITYENRKMHNLRWPAILNHHYRIIINGFQDSGKQVVI